ncbi:MAG TPA: diguanylate cyclase [Kofleriaceae bacterium]|nr:diguanylate cyclase [Kofleriaceae bacterium]
MTSEGRPPSGGRAETVVDDDLAATQEIPTDAGRPQRTSSEWLERAGASDAPEVTLTQVAIGPYPPVDNDGATVIGPPPQADGATPSRSDGATVIAPPPNADATVIGPPPRPDTEPTADLGAAVTIAVYEATDAHRQRATTMLEQLGHRVIDPAEISASEPPAVILVGFPGGARIVASALALGANRPILVAALSGEARTLAERAGAAGCDLFTARPHTRDSLAQAIAAAGALGRAHERVAVLESAEAVLSERVERLSGADTETGLHPFELFQRLLVMELKRARRYGYPLAVCLMSVDRWPDSQPRDELRVRAAQALTACIRDVDLPVDLGGDRFLVFLPYTSASGAKRVGERITGAASAALFGKGVTGGVSVGVAAIEPGPGQPVSFARLIGEASTALRAAQARK